MAGPRPGGGRPSRYVYNIGNNTYHSLKEAAKCEGVSTMTITRWCNSGKEGCSREDAKQGLDEAVSSITDDISGYSEKAKVKPLDFWFYILDHPERFNEKTRMQAAYYLAPYVHPKASGSMGKKEDLAERAKKVGAGKFSSGPAPLKAVK
jgi:hypothetical protein